MLRILGPFAPSLPVRRVSYVGKEVAIFLSDVIWWQRVKVEAVRGGGACLSLLPWSFLDGVALVCLLSLP